MFVISFIYIIVQEVTTALDRFSRYHHIWREDRDATMQTYDHLNDSNIHMFS